MAFIAKKFIRSAPSPSQLAIYILTGIAIDHHFIEGAYEKIYPYFKGYEICQKWNETAKGVYMARYF